MQGLGRLLVAFALAGGAAVAIGLLARGDPSWVPPGFAEGDCHVYPDYKGPLLMGTCSKSDPPTLAAVWHDHDDEAGYEVSAAVQYYTHSCDRNPTLVDKGRPEASVLLPENSRWFIFPPPDDPDANLIKDFEFHVAAVDGSGHALATDGTAVTGEPPPCRADAGTEEGD